MAAPGVGDVKGFPSPYSSSVVCERLVQDFGTLWGNLEHHVAIRDGNLGIAAEVPFEERVAAISQTVLGSIVWSGHKTVQRNRHVEYNFTHKAILCFLRVSDAGQALSLTTSGNTSLGGLPLNPGSATGPPYRSIKRLALFFPKLRQDARGCPRCRFPCRLRSCHPGPQQTDRG